MDEIKKKMEQIVSHLRDELKNLRTGRPNPAVLDPVVVEAYGTEMRIRDLATVAVSDERQLVITPFDGQITSAIGKGIEKANIGLNPVIDGNMIRIPIPEMTEEIRKGIAKEAKDKGEKAKIAIRDCRRKGNDWIKKQKAAGEFSEDDQKKKEKEVQELTDRFCKEIDELCSKKEKDILAV